MKKILLLSIILCFGASQLTWAQKERIEYLPNFDKRKLHFGYYLGLNYSSFQINYWDQSGQDPNSPVNPTPNSDMFVQQDPSIGFTLGFIIDLRLHQNINLRFEPGLISHSNELTFLDHNAANTPNYNGTLDPVRKVNGTYMHLPLLFKFSTNRYNNIRPYVIGGVSYDFNFSSNEDNPEDNYNDEFRMTTHNFMYEVGIGVDFYLYFFKFSPSIRGVFAINDQLVPDFPSGESWQGKPVSSPWTGPIDGLKMRGVFLNLTFE